MTNAVPPDRAGYPAMPQADPRARQQLVGEDPSSKGLATAALICGCIPTPLTVLAALGMGFAVVGRGKVRAGRGWGMAIGGLAAVGVWVLIVGLFVAVAATSSDQTSGQTHRALPRQLRIGDCVQMPSGRLVGRVLVVSCSVAHEAEVYDRFDLEGTEYRGEAVTEDLAEDGCFDRLVDFTGEGTPPDDLVVNWFMPSRQTWPDPTVVCLVGREHTTTTGTLRGVVGQVPAPESRPVVARG